MLILTWPHSTLWLEKCKHWCKQPCFWDIYVPQLQNMYSTIKLLTETSWLNLKKEAFCSFWRCHSINVSKQIISFSTILNKFPHNVWPILCKTVKFSKESYKNTCTNGLHGQFTLMYISTTLIPFLCCSHLFFLTQILFSLVNLCWSLYFVLSQCSIALNDTQNFLLVFNVKQIEEGLSLQTAN